MSQLRAIYFLVVLSLIGLTATAGVPQLVNFQGQLKNNSGSPLMNDTLAVEFKIYDAVSAGNVKWSEIDTVITDANGLFTILLGKKTPVPDSAFNDSLRWLGIKVGSDAEISPRSQLSSVGYSYASSQWNSAGENLFRLNGKVGIGTATPDAQLVVQSSAGEAIRGIGVGSSGVVGTSDLIGVYGEASQYGVSGYGNSAGVVGTSPSNGSGVIGHGIGSFGTGVYGDGGTYGVSGGGGTYGVHGQSGQYGVYGNGGTYGVYGTGGTVYGTYGVYGTGGTYGVYGRAANTSSAVGYGIFGSNGGNVYHYAGYFEGEVYVTGFLTKAGGGFKIDHPTDPANKYLYHSFVESPDMKNIYDGVVTIDAKGEAIVALPDWFGALNKDFRYQLTAIGAPGPNLYIAEEISGNQFKIAGGMTGMKVSWQVTGIRKDAFAEAHRLPVEEEKSATEQGKYLHPKEHGVSETLGMHYEMSQSMEAERKNLEEQRIKMEQEASPPKQ